jgi:hypothetical protein
MRAIADRRSPETRCAQRNTEHTIMRKQHWYWRGLACLAVAASLPACGGAAVEGDDGPGSDVASAEPRIEDFQRDMDELSRALVERDVGAFEGMVSSEVMERGAERGIDPPTLLEKQRGALMRTFDLEEGAFPDLEVVDVEEQGDAVRVTLALEGQDLEKPFYFVREHGEYLLNIAPPGFSKAAPEGALFGKSNYTISNVNHPTSEPGALSCYQGGNPTIVPAGSTRKVSCGDACGFWAGSIFANAQAYDGPQKYCDWNAWGADVIINFLSFGGFYCADYC